MIGLIGEFTSLKFLSCSLLLFKVDCQSNTEFGLSSSLSVSYPISFPSTFSSVILNLTLPSFIVSPFDNRYPEGNFEFHNWKDLTKNHTHSLGALSKFSFTIHGFSLIQKESRSFIKWRIEVWMTSSLLNNVSYWQSGTFMMWLWFQNNAPELEFVLQESDTVIN